MATGIESVVTTDGSEQSPWNVCFWDASTGAVQGVFKGGMSGQGCISMVGNSYLLSTQKDKPLLQVWELNKKEQLHMRMVLPGKVSALSVCPNGTYCLAAIQEKFHLWMISTGQLLAVVTRHFQPITCVKFTDDGSLFLTSGEDGNIYLWELSSVLNPKGASPEPLRTYQKHSMQVTNLVVGIGRDRARFASVSNDHTCRLYNLILAEVLVSFVLETALTSVAMDPAEFHLFLGAVDGSILQIDLFSSPPSKDIHFSEEEKKEMLFHGHSKQVTSLSVSFDGNHLLSGSYDHSARVWHIPSKQCLRVLAHKGPVLNAFFTLTPLALTQDNVYQAQHLLAQFQRHLGTTEGERNTLPFFLKNEKEYKRPSFDSKLISSIVGKSLNSGPGESKVEMQGKLSKTQKVNQQLYSYAVDTILKSIVNNDGS